MRVETKYGSGTLLGICASTPITYKVLIDADCANGNVESRVYNCMNVHLVTEEGDTVKLSANFIEFHL